MSAYASNRRLHRCVQVPVWGLSRLCRALRQYGPQIAPSTYYAFKVRPPSVRSRSDELVEAPLMTAFHTNYSCYGARKLWRELKGRGHTIGRDRVARLMRLYGIRGARRVKRIVTTVAAPVRRDLPDLVKRRWDTGEPDRVWVADLTYVPSSEGMVYTSFIQDAGTRRSLGFTVATSMGASLVTRALEQAIATRKRRWPGFTADRGS